MALEHLEFRGRVTRPLGGNANMHWLVERDGSTVVLRRYGPWRGSAEITYEIDVMNRLKERGWPVPEVLAGPVAVGRHQWCLFTRLPGFHPRPRNPSSVIAEQRARGRLLAELHADLTDLSNLGQREGWVRREEVLNERPDGPSLEQLLREHEPMFPEEVRVLRGYAEQVRERLSQIGAEKLSVIVNHGDLVSSNVLFLRGKLSGLIDFDATHLDHRVADFAWTWRGKHDEFVRGYEEVSPLNEVEQEMLAPAWWAWVLDAVRMALLWPTPGPVTFDYPISQLSRGSPLMILRPGALCA